MKPAWVWEVSFECGNKVGGIWTVITSKAETMKKIFGDHYITVGFYDPRKVEMLKEEPPEWLKKIFVKLEKLGLRFHYGKWIEGGNVNLILIDSNEFERKHVNEIKKTFWETYRIDSLFAGPDYNEPLAWSYAAGMLIEEAAKITTGIDVAHFHEWLSGGGLLYLAMKRANVPTVFTTHATVLGRALGGKVDGVDPEQEAREMGVIAKHLTEKAAAVNADVFTTVSDVIGEEVKKVLGRKPDIITYNALDETKLDDLSQLIRTKFKLREKLEEFLKAYFLPYYSMNFEDYPIIYTSGRYEFYNKGFDLFIKALGYANQKLKESNSSKWVAAFLLVPAGTLGVKDEVIQNFVVYRRMKELLLEDVGKMTEKVVNIIQDEKAASEQLSEIILDLKRLGMRFMSRRGKTPPLCPFQLSYREEEDMILQELKRNGLLNREEDRVKVIFYPVYLNRQDELLGMRYIDFITAGSMGIFLSRYEPWGYTPLEAAAYLSVAVTTNISGFGRAVKLRLGKKAEGIKVVEMNEKVHEKVGKLIVDFASSPKDVRLEMEINAHKTARIFTWKKMIRRYVKAYELAVGRFARKIALSETA